MTEAELRALRKVAESPICSCYVSAFDKNGDLGSDPKWCDRCRARAELARIERERER